MRWEINGPPHSTLRTPRSKETNSFGGLHTPCSSRLVRVEAPAALHCCLSSVVLGRFRRVVMNMQPSITDDLARPLHAIPGLLASYDGRNHNQLFNSVAAHFGKLGAPDHLQQVLAQHKQHALKGMSCFNKFGYSTCCQHIALTRQLVLQVPILTNENAESIPANTLVRFRGMVGGCDNNRRLIHVCSSLVSR